MRCSAHIGILPRRPQPRAASPGLIVVIFSIGLLATRAPSGIHGEDNDTSTFRRAFCAAAFALSFGPPAFAHHPGGATNAGGAGPITTISASTLEAGHGAVAFLYEYIKFGGLGDAALIAAAGQHIHAHSIDTVQSASASAAYGVTDDFMVAVRIPYFAAPTFARAITRTGRAAWSATPSTFAAMPPGSATSR